MATSSAIPKSYTAVVIKQPGPDARISLEQRSVPRPGPGELLVCLSHSGVCHGDVSLVYDDWRELKFTIENSETPGHEGIGTVVSVGQGVHNFRVGDRTGVRWIYSVCGSCRQCLNKVIFLQRWLMDEKLTTIQREERCPNQVHSGRQVNGSFQQYILVPASNSLHIPTGIKSEDAGPLLCAGVTMYRALKFSRLEPGEWVAITGGGGGLGHLGIQFAKAMSLRVIAIDTGSDKEALCRQFGADDFLDYATTKDLVGKVMSLTDGGANAVVAVAASKASYIQGAAMLAVGGCLTCIGLPHDKLDMPMTVAECIGKSCHIIGINAGSLADTEETLQFVAKHDIKVSTQVFQMSQAEEVFQKLAAGTIVGRAVLDLRTGLDV
ncbi:hypothetical protein PV10_01629 [Exophiala mesophila]|uniref:alcohol dehydrogenase n=1 Tax=Exophiala mesophila TaxID=212818 RepID=A0A0D2AG81_EXOME|nr:uncharacterized protein PV10_01629 [Exophiala mesophila]KIV97928.1 hypothetical protein PV10_01629 [Exophiala mesophila]